MTDPLNIASWFIYWLVSGEIWSRSFWWDNHSLQTRVDSCSVDATTQYSIHGSLSVWHSHWVCWSDYSACLSLTICLYGLLSWEVHSQSYLNVFVTSTDMIFQQDTHGRHPQHGLCPCSRCLIKKTELSALGTLRDNSQRAKIWINNHHFRTKISLAREIIYKHGLCVDADAVNNLLKEESLVPTTVCQ